MYIAKSEICSLLMLMNKPRECERLDLLVRSPEDAGRERLVAAVERLVAEAVQRHFNLTLSILTSDRVCLI